MQKSSTLPTRNPQKTAALNPKQPAVLIQQPKRTKYPPFHDKWSLFYHASDDKNWDLSSYTLIMQGINDPEQLISINETIPENIVKNTMLFVMRDTIQPIWEDERNRNGGYLSFKIMNKMVHHIWKSIMYAVCGETLFKTKEYNQLVNGISISSKKTFCIIKIWFANCEIQDATDFNFILNLANQETKFTPFSATS